MGRSLSFYTVAPCLTLYWAHFEIFIKKIIATTNYVTNHVYYGIIGKKFKKIATKPDFLFVAIWQQCPFRGYNVNKK